MDILVKEELFSRLEDTVEHREWLRLACKDYD
jgi:hypothetical protein